MLLEKHQCSAHLTVLIALEGALPEPLHVTETGGKLEHHPHPRQAQAIVQRPPGGFYVRRDFQSPAGGHFHLGGDPKKHAAPAACQTPAEGVDGINRERLWKEEVGVCLCNVTLYQNVRNGFSVA